MGVPTVASWHRRPRLFQILFLGSLATLTLFYFSFSFSSITPPINKFRASWLASQSRKCPPRAYSNGTWTGPYFRTSERVMTSSSQALSFSGFDGCASPREFQLQLGADNQGQWDRFPKAQSYKWTVGEHDGCANLREWDKEQVVRELVEQGGWLMLGDSISENHFFSLSCLLYPHVIPIPDYTNRPFDRAWSQNLHLNPASPLLRPSSSTHKQLRLPDGYNMTLTPLVTYLRVDLLLQKAELEQLHRSLHFNTPTGFTLFSDEATWTLGPNDYMPLLLNGSFSTMIVSTAGHWTTTLFGGYNDPNTPPFGGANPGIDGVIDLFSYAMRYWADEVQAALRVAATEDGGARRRQVVVRAYLHGHEDCHQYRDPFTDVQPLKTNPWNWRRIPDYNRIFEDIVRDDQKYPDIHFLAIDRPGLLRPDSHTTHDCLHIMAGAGVTEGWTHYIWHFISRELEQRRPWWSA